MTHEASQVSKFTRVVNNCSTMSELFEPIKNRDFEGEPSDLKLDKSNNAVIDLDVLLNCIQFYDSPMFYDWY